MSARIRQVVLAARDLDAVAGELRRELGLGEPFSDPGVAYFGLRNNVFALGGTFLEVISPVRPDTSAGRLLDRRGGDCGYMVMFQVDDLAAARARAGAAGVREVFELLLDDIEEVHLHPADIGGAIVSLSTPKPADAWRWGGPDWQQRSSPPSIVGAEIAVADPGAVSARWHQVLGELPSVSFAGDDGDRGLCEVVLAASSRPPVEIGGVRFVFDSNDEE